MVTRVPAIFLPERLWFKVMGKSTETEIAEKVAKKVSKLTPQQKSESYKKSDLYSSLTFYKGYIYIHLHQNNIGLAKGNGSDGTPLNDSDIAGHFNKYKTGKNSTVGQAIKNQYIQLLKSSISRNNLTNEQYSLLNNVLDVKNNNVEAILGRLNKILQKGFEDQFTTTKITDLLNNEDKTNWKEKSSSFKELTEILEGKNNKSGFKTLNKILQDMADTVKLLQTPEGDELATIISNNLKNNYVDPKTIGSCLNKAINEFSKKQNGKTIESRDVLKAAEYFKNVTNGLETGTNSRDEPLKTKGLQGLVQKSFYSLIAEIFASHLDKAAKNSAVQYIIDSVKDIDIIGDVSVSLEVTDPDGNYGGDLNTNPNNRTFFQNSGSPDQNYGKADLRFNNVQVNLSSLFEDDKGLGSIQMSVGISSKAYVRNEIGANSLKDFQNQRFELGGGMTIGNAIKLLNGGNDLFFKYLCYNTLTKGPTSTIVNDGRAGRPFKNTGLSQSYGALQNIILTRSILYLAGGRSQEDFANFIFMNGKLLSMWDIVKYAIDNPIGSTKESDERGLAMQIPSEKLYQAYSRNKYLAIRVEETNKTIDRAVIKGLIYPGRIADQMNIP